MPENNKKIKPKLAETISEKILLGFLAEEADRVVYGKITVEVTVHNSKLTNVSSQPSKRTLNLHNAE